MAELDPVYLHSGSDRPKIARALQRLRGRIGEDAVELRSAQDTSGDEVVAACNARGLFGGSGRLVVVDEVERWKAADVKGVVEYLRDPAPDTVLALVSAESKKDSALAKACAKAGKVLVYEVTKRKLPEWVAEQFARLGTRADPAACRLLVEFVGDNLDELNCEIDKLATWAAGEPIDVAAVESLSAPRAETSVFGLTDSWGRRDTAACLRTVELLLERSGQPRARELPRIVGLLSNQVTRVRACQRLAAEGVRPRDAAARLGMHPFAAEKAFAQADNFSADELRAAVVRLARLDHALKGGSRLAGDLELERAIVDLSRTRGAAAA